MGAKISNDDHNQRALDRINTLVSHLTQEEEPTTISQFDKTRYKLTDTLRESDINQKALHHDQTKRLEKLYNFLERNHRHSAYKMTIAIVASALGIVGGAFEADAKAGKIINAVSNVGGKVSDFLQQMDQADRKKLDGLIDLLKQELQDGSKTKDHIIERLREIDNLLDKAEQKRHEAISRALGK
ncbi:MAG: hypothetical protein S4CHLAM20_08580 [Chlamydiia bacterium]|nr:hypothetical protein [Chlamydiia bacterium]